MKITKLLSVLALAVAFVAPARAQSSDYNATNFEHFEDVMDKFNAEDYA